MGLIPKVIKRYEAQDGLEHQNWLTFFSTFSNAQIILLFRSTIDYLDQLSPYRIVFSFNVTAYILICKILSQTVSYA